VTFSADELLPSPNRFVDGSLLKALREVANMREVALSTWRRRPKSSMGPQQALTYQRHGWNFGAENWSYYESGDDTLGL
jgi:hypothetical protein